MLLHLFVLLGQPAHLLDGLLRLAVVWSEARENGTTDLGRNMSREFINIVTEMVVWL